MTTAAVQRNRARSRFLVATIAMVAFAGLAILGTQLADCRETTKGRAVQTDQGTVRFPDQKKVDTLADTLPALLPTALLVLLSALLVLLVGPRMRTALLGAVIVAAVWLLVVYYGGQSCGTYPGGPVRGPSLNVRSRGPAGIVLQVGAMGSMVCAVVAVRDAHRVPRLRMPERAPDESTLHGTDDSRGDGAR